MGLFLLILQAPGLSLLLFIHLVIHSENTAWIHLVLPPFQDLHSAENRLKAEGEASWDI